jgi:endogenous inhibitor of DNA gyrase (YacG/DUF329 family)
MAEPLSCPVCKRPVATADGQRPASFPFCSSRCRTIDLAAWASGAYVVPGRPVDGHDLPADLPDAGDEPPGGRR